MDSGPAFDTVPCELEARAAASDPPDLKGTAFARDENGREELALEELDGLAPPGDDHQ